MASDAQQKIWELTVRRSGGRPLEYNQLAYIKKIEIQHEDGKVITILPHRVISMLAERDHGATRYRQLSIEVSEWYEDGEYKPAATV